MITLYTTNCPKCLMLEKQLDAKNVLYTKNNDVDAMIEKGIMMAPVLEVDGQMLDYITAMKYVKEL